MSVLSTKLGMAFLPNGTQNLLSPHHGTDIFMTLSITELTGYKSV